jgi:hypothetical protein
VVGGRVGGRVVSGKNGANSVWKPAWPFRSIVAALLVLVLSATSARAEDRFLARVTYYHPTGDPMYSGQPPYWTAAACSSRFPIGTVILLAGRDGAQLIVKCLDRGRIDSEDWVDCYCDFPGCGEWIARFFSPYAPGAILTRERSAS